MVTLKSPPAGGTSIFFSEIRVRYEGSSPASEGSASTRVMSSSVHSWQRGLQSETYAACSRWNSKCAKSVPMPVAREADIIEQAPGSFIIELIFKGIRQFRGASVSHPFAEYTHTEFKGLCSAYLYIAYLHPGFSGIESACACIEVCGLLIRIFCTGVGIWVAFRTLP